VRQPLTERYRERLAGVLSCYDRIIVTGTLPRAFYAINGLMAEGGSAARSLNCNSPTDLAQAGRRLISVCLQHVNKGIAVLTNTSAGITSVRAAWMPKWRTRADSLMRAAISLIADLNSLQGRKKFPVRMRRELAHNVLIYCPFLLAFTRRGASNR
jgi:hypothetical protein